MSNKHNMREESGMSLCITGKDFTVHKNPDCIYVTNPEIIRFLIAANFKSGKEAFVKFIWRSGTLDDGGQPEEARMADEQQVEHSAEDLERARKIVVTMLKRRKETLDNPEYGGTEIDYWADEIQAQFATIRAEERQKAEKLLAEAEKCDLVQRLRAFAERSENADWSDGINRAADELTEWLAARGINERDALERIRHDGRAEGLQMAVKIIQGAKGIVGKYPDEVRDALERVKAGARLEEAKWWELKAVTYGLDWQHDKCRERLAALEAQAKEKP